MNRNLKCDLLWQSREIRTYGARVKTCCQTVCLWGLVLAALSRPPAIEAKAWLNGHIVELHGDSLIMCTRFRPRVAVHFSKATAVHCRQHALSVGDLKPDDLVTVESHVTGSSLEATRITLHRDPMNCGKIETPTLARCRC